MLVRIKNHFAVFLHVIATVHVNVLLKNQSTIILKVKHCLAQFAIDLVLAGRRCTSENAFTLDTVIAADL